MNKSAARPRENGGQMTCAEFQKLLPYLFESGSNTQDHEHL